MAPERQRTERRILVALDTTDAGGAEALARRLAGAVGGVKLGSEFFTANGPAGLARVAAAGLPVFLDLKFHDIPNTVAGGVRAAAGLGVAMLTVHAAGGPAMMRAAAVAAREGAAAAGHEPPLVLAITVLTSLGAEDLEAVGVTGGVENQVRRLAGLARDCGLDGAVCAAGEIAAVREACGPHFTLVVPGIRPEWAGRDDQKRTMTPAEAVAAGADHLVIGRPITRADDPLEAARRIAAEIAET